MDYCVNYLTMNHIHRSYQFSRFFMIVKYIFDVKYLLLIKYAVVYVYCFEEKLRNWLWIMAVLPTYIYDQLAGRTIRSGGTRK